MKKRVFLIIFSVIYFGFMSNSCTATESPVSLKKIAKTSTVTKQDILDLSQNLLLKRDPVDKEWIKKVVSAMVDDPSLVFDEDTLNLVPIFNNPIAMEEFERKTSQMSSTEIRDQMGKSVQIGLASAMFFSNNFSGTYEYATTNPSILPSSSQADTNMIALYRLLVTFDSSGVLRYIRFKTEPLTGKRANIFKSLFHTNITDMMHLNAFSSNAYESKSIREISIKKRITNTYNVEARLAREDKNVFVYVNKQEGKLYLVAAAKYYGDMFYMQGTDTHSNGEINRGDYFGVMIDTRGKMYLTFRLGSSTFTGNKDIFDKSFVPIVQDGKDSYDTNVPFVTIMTNGLTNKAYFPFVLTANYIIQ